MAATRLRRTFHYPSESDDEDAVEAGMDEQDQETLITSLSNRDTTSTRYYTYFLLLLPLSPTLLYVPHLFAFSTAIPSLAAIISLLASAYTLYFLPLPPVRPNIITLSSMDPTSPSKGKSIQRDAHGFKSSTPPSERRPVPYISEEVADMLAKYVVPINGALCILLALVELWQGREWREGMTIGGGYVPGFIMAIVMWARRELRVVDLGELERLRYRTKGS
ncbi:hypothetical protein BU26DRAFT_472519 [Trematosphaeria pertusa]|uniref:Uncharacterized protein n=1 Tax=Trematosphaeria pertusa TaxID=390896 RepID=A0A6A6J0W2_9PLEO|nr:uncharacterized protein BU26DRAFT_472519 [Trematosphaeria pertusa]KAF2256339.1 hypothetical protein BU26DRAFT_472519 [Trematosphaeria pertusa]